MNPRRTQREGLAYCIIFMEVDWLYELWSDVLEKGKSLRTRGLNDAIKPGVKHLLVESQESHNLVKGLQKIFIINYTQFDLLWTKFEDGALVCLWFVGGYIVFG